MYILESRNDAISPPQDIELEPQIELNTLINFNELHNFVKINLPLKYIEKLSNKPHKY